jgi:hypothetical protein
MKKPVLACILAGSAVVIAAGVLGAQGVHQPSAAAVVTTTVPAAGSAITTADPTPSSTTTPSPTTAAAAGVLFSLTGSGSVSTAQFTVPAGGWRLNWSYNCSTYVARGMLAMLGAQVYEGTTGDINDVGVQHQGSAADAAGSQVYYDAGTFNLKIISPCNWEVEALAGS